MPENTLAIKNRRGPNQYGSALHLQEDSFWRQRRRVLLKHIYFHFDQSNSEIAFFCMPLGQTQKERVYLYVNLSFHFHHCSWFIKCKCYVGSEPGKQTDHEMLCFRKRWKKGGECMRRRTSDVRTFFLAVFLNLLLRVFFIGQVTRDQNNRIRRVEIAQSALESRICVLNCWCAKFSSLTAERAVWYSFFTHCHGSK